MMLRTICFGFQSVVEKVKIMTKHFVSLVGHYIIFDKAKLSVSWSLRKCKFIKPRQLFRIGKVDRKVCEGTLYDT